MKKLPEKDSDLLELALNDLTMTLTAKHLVDEGYLQTSSKYCHVGKLPSDKTALELLETLDPDTAAHIRRRMEDLARSICLRVHGVGQVTVSPEVLREFRKLGGNVA